MKKLAIISTHPIQYYAPVFKLLAVSCTLKVFYTRGETDDAHDPEFARKIEWDIPLLDGYDYEFVFNTGKNIPQGGFWSISNPDLIKKIASFSPHAILVYGWAYQSHLKAMRYFKGKIPLWFRGDSHWLDPQKPIKNFIRKQLLTWVYCHVDLAFYVGKANKAYFLALGLKENQLCFAPHTVDNERFTQSQAEAVQNLRQSLGIPKSAIVVLFAGKFIAKKNPEGLIRAFAQAQVTQSHLLLVGNGALEESLKLKAESLKLNIHFMDVQNQSYMPVVYQACDLFVLPSIGPGETWGLAVNEAMAAGKAVLVSNRAGCSIDLVQEGVNGFTFDVQSTEDFGNKIKDLIANPAQLVQMGQKSRLIIANWTIKAQVKAILATLYATQ